MEDQKTTSSDEDLNPTQDSAQMPLSQPANLESLPGSPSLPVQSFQAADAKPKKSKKKLIFISLIFALVLLASGAIYALILSKNSSNNSSKNNNTQQLGLLKDISLVRYEIDGAYQKDETGSIKKIDSNTFVRKDSFTIEVDRNGKTNQITLDNKTWYFGKTTDGQLYAISCSSPEYGKTGADDPEYTAQIYNLEGTKKDTKKWHLQDATAPFAFPEGYSLDGCDTSTNPSFTFQSDLVLNLNTKNYGREHIDALNYKVVFITKDGTKKNIDNETSTDIDIPLGASPDEKYFMYNRVSSKQTEDGCGDEVNLSYKVPDFFGPINELHAVEVATGKDTLIGTEKSFAIPDYPINLSIPGYFSADSARYFLTAGDHSGCSGGDSKPIRIAYIDMKTLKLKTIVSPVGKTYASYCHTENGKYIMEYDAVHDDSKEDAKQLANPIPSILNTSTDDIYAAPDGIFGCNVGFAKNMFTALQYDINDSRTRPSELLGLRILDPETKNMRSVTLDKPISLSENKQIKESGLTFNQNVGYLYRNGDTFNDFDVFLFNLTTGETKSIPYAKIIL